MRTFLLAAIVLVLTALILVFVIPPWREAVLRPFRGPDGPPPELPPRASGWGMLNTAPMHSEDLRGKGKLTPGIDFCSYNAHSYDGDGRPGASDFVFFIWSDFDGGASGGRTTGKEGLRFRGVLHDQWGKREIGFQGATKDGQSGSVTIDGKNYDLAAGTLFLVSSRRGYQVKQLKRDLTRFADAEQLFLELGKSDPDVMEFFPRAIATSPDGQWLAVAKEKAIRVMEAKSEKVVAEYAGHKDTVMSLAFAPDSKTLASGGKDNLVLLWSVPGNDPPRKIDVPGPVYYLEYLDAATLRVSEDTSPKVQTYREYDVNSGKQVRVSSVTGG